MSKIIGIDLGTTNSLAAVWQNGESVLIPNAFGEYLTPSVVSVGEDDTVYVGKTAKERLVTHPKETASVFKRFMGTNKKYRLGGRTYLPEELSALVLMKLKEDAERYLGEEVEEAIISVPAYFNDTARNATKRAGQIAGWKVERIINEPSAAALACQNERKAEEATMLVFDFGGGTLDVSLVDCFDNVIEITAISGDNRLGGQDFDDMIAKHFLKVQGLDEAQLAPETMGVIRRSAELCKRALTENQTARMAVRCPEIHAEMDIVSADVVDFCAPLFERMGRPVSQVLLDRNLSAEQIDDVVLVGGSCKMPLVRQYLAHLLKRSDIETIDPDHVIALGCGVCAGIKERNAQIKDMLLTDICPFSLGVNTYNDEITGRGFDIEHENALMSVIIERNSPLPISIQRTYVPVSRMQFRCNIGIYQGEGKYVRDNINLGQIKIKFPPNRMDENVFYVRFTYDINGILEVEVDGPLVREKKRLVIVNKELSMTEEQIQKKLKEFEKIKINPAAEEQNRYIMDWGSRLYMQCSDELREDIGDKLEQFRQIMYKDSYKLKQAQKDITAYLEHMEEVINSFIHFSEDDWKNGGWYQDGAEEETKRNTEEETYENPQ